MNFTLSLFSISLLLSTGISLVLARSVIKQHAGSARITLSLLMLAVAEWSFSSFMEAVATSTQAKMLWHTLGYLGATAVPVLFFIFALEFSTQKNWLRQRTLRPIWIVPLLTAVIAITNPWTSWLWEQYLYLPGMKILVFYPGPYAWIATIYSYALTFASLAFLIRAVVFFRESYRSQAIVTLVAALFPVFANLSYIFGRPLFAGLDLTPYAFVLTGIVIAWGIQHFQYLTPLPVARDELVELLSDTVIVLNDQYQVTYLNPAACKIIGISLDQAVGLPAKQVLQNWSYLVDRFSQKTTGANETLEIQGKDQRWYETQISLLKDRRERVSGCLIVIHDITRRKVSELLQAKLVTGLQTVAEVSTAITTTLDTQKLLQTVADLTKERFELYHVQIYISDPTRKNLFLATGSGKIGSVSVSQEKSISIDDDPTPVARAARTNQGVIVNDVLSEPGFIAYPLLPETRAEMAIPITTSNQLLGVLDVLDDHAERFTPQDVIILTTLAAQIAVALRNADTFSQLQMLLEAQRKELALLNAMAAKAAEAPSIKDLLAWTTEQIPQAMKHPEVCSVSILYENRLIGQTPEEKNVNQIAQEIQLAGEVIGKVFVSYQHPFEFLPEEQSLLLNVVQRLQSYIVEVTLRQSQTQLQEALQIARMGHFELDLVSGVFTLSDEFYELLGTSAVEERGYQMPLDGIKKYLPPEDRKKAKNDLREIMQSPDLSFIEREYRFINYQNSLPSTRHALLRAQIYRDDQGKAITLTGTIQDITERIKVDAEILRLATVIEQAKEAILITDLNGNIVYANPYFETITGYSVTEVLGKNPRILKSGQQDAAFYEVLWNTIRRGETWNGIFINKRKDGSTYHEAATIFPIKDSAGNIINYATVKRDISDQVAAEQEIRTFARQQELLNDITQAALEQTDFISMLKIVAQRLCELYIADGCYITLWDENRGVPIPVAAHGRLSETYSSMSAEPSDKTLTGSVLEVGHPLAVDDVFDTPYISPRIASLFPTRSALGLPLIASGKKLGAAMITFSQPHHFTEHEIAQGEQAASQIALALLKGQLLDEEQKQRHLAERLQEIGRILSTTLDIEHLLDLILDQIQDIVPYDLGSLLLLEGNMARVVRSRGLYPPVTERATGQVTSEPINVLKIKNFYEIVQTRRPVVIADTQDYADWASYHPTSAMRSWIGAPIIARDDLIGFLCLEKSSAGFYKSEHISCLEAFTGQASLALQNARLFETAQRKAKESETLRQAASAITRSLKLEETIEIILEQLNRVIPYDSASVLFLHGNELEIVGGHGFQNPSEVLGLKFSLDGDNPCALVYSTRQPYILEDAPSMYKAFTQHPHDRIRSWLGVPLILQGRVTGMIALDSFKKGTFTSDHVRLASAYADQVAIVLENARLFAQTQELAITDPLTGLYNRRYFFSQAKMEFERARRYQGPLSIIMLDIDDFKRINDTYGHLIGDQVLQSLAKLCRENVREIDVVGRYGGEEFVILLPETPLVISQPVNSTPTSVSEETMINSGAVSAAERLRQIVAQTPIQTEKATIQITISLGVAEYQPDISSPEMLLDHADKALYQAKQAGKNRVAIFGKD